MWSDRNANHHNTFAHNTMSVPLLANGFAIYGGHDNTVTREHRRRHGHAGWRPCGQPVRFGAACRDDDIGRSVGARGVDSSFSGIQFYGKAITNVTVDRVSIADAGSFAV